MLSGPGITLTPGSASIAAIELLSSVGHGGCGVSWLNWPVPTSRTLGQPRRVEQICPGVSPTDAGWTANSCASRHACMPDGQPPDGGAECRWATIDVLGWTGETTICAVTVISTTGERQSFEVSGAFDTKSYLCNANPGQCVEIFPLHVSVPSEMTLTFAPPARDAAAPEGGTTLDAI